MKPDGWIKIHCTIPNCIYYAQVQFLCLDGIYAKQFAFKQFDKNWRIVNDGGFFPYKELKQIQVLDNLPKTLSAKLCV